MNESLDGKIVANLVSFMHRAQSLSQQTTQALESFGHLTHTELMAEREWPMAVQESLKSLSGMLTQLSESINRAHADVCETQHKWAAGTKLDRSEYYLITGAGGLNYTNKSFGLAKFDDYEIYCFFCYEDKSRSVYIDPTRKPRHPPEVYVRDDGTEVINVRVDVGEVEAPEDLEWKELRAEQQSFFAQHLPDVASRFKREPDEL